MSIADELWRTAQDQKPSLELDPFDRALLSSDGTVTTLIEALSGEPVCTTTLWQSEPATFAGWTARTEMWWEPDAIWLRLTPSDQLVARRTVLAGRRSQSVYVLAESLVVPSRLPQALRGWLTPSDPPNGSELSGSLPETRREILSFSSEPAGDAATYLHADRGTTVAMRTYRVFVERQPVFLASELIATGRLAFSALAANRLSRVDFLPKAELPLTESCRLRRG